MADRIRSFELTYEDQPQRIVRGRVEVPSASGPHPVVLVLHGFKGFMDWGFFPELSRRLADGGFVAVSFNMSGSGVGADLETFSDDEGFAKNTYSRELEDTERVRRFIDDQVPEADGARAGLFGHSLGGGVGLIHAAERGDYRAIVTWASVSRLDRFDEAAREEWRRTGHLYVHNGRTGQDHRLDLGWLEDAEANLERFDVPAACSRLAAPTLVIHGTADEAVAFEEGERLHAALDPAHGRMLTIEGGGHTFGATHPLGGVHGDLERALEATLGHFGQTMTR